MRLILILLAGLFGLAALVTAFPLSWVTASVPDEVGSFSGTVWDGQVADVPLFGTLSIKGGPGYADIASPPGDVILSGRVSPSGAKDVILSMPVSRLPASDARLTGLLGRISIRIDEAVVEEGRCVSAVGTASTDVLAANAAQFDWTGPELSGPVDCDDGRLRVRLAGVEGAERVEATVVTGLDGIYRSDIAVTTADPIAGNALSLFGFVSDGSGQYSLLEQGRWR